MRSLLLMATSLFFIQFAQAASYQQLKTDIEQAYGIEIEFDNIKYPAVWEGAVKAAPHKSSNISRKKSLKRLLVDLKKYRVPLIKAHLKKVFLVKDLYLEGVIIAGTYFYPNRSLFLDVSGLGGVDPGDTLFHHEFSSLLLINYYTESLQLKWSRLNPSDFTYLIETPGGTVLGGDNDLKGYDKVFKKGFVAGYGQSSFENDFNTYFELMIGNPVKLAKLEVKYPAIKKKAEMLREFYYGAIAATIQTASTN